MVLLIAGFVLAKPFLIMWSIVVSVLSALFLVIGAFLRRNELFPGGGQAAAPATPPKGLMPSAPPYNQTGPMVHQQHTPPRPQPQAPPHAPQRTAATAPAPVPRRPAPTGISPDAIVLVIPGRKRYHVPGCRQLIGRDHEELTYEEAREEGFTPCTTCLPDAALGGRQLPPAADPEPAVTPGAVTSGTTTSGTTSGTAPAADVPAASRAESSAETRDVRPPVAPPKPDTKASTPSPEPAASHEEEGATGWFGRPPAAAPGQGKAPSSAAPEPGSGDEQADETQTSFFRPPPFARKAGPSSGESEETETSPGNGRPPGKTSRPEAVSPGQANGTSERAGRPDGGAGPAGGKPGPAGARPGQSGGRPGQSGDRPGQSGGRPPGQTAASPEQAGGEPGQSGAKPPQTGGRPPTPDAKPSVAGGKPQTPGDKAPAPGGKPQTPGEKAPGSGGKPQATSGESPTPGGKPQGPGGKSQTSGGRPGPVAGAAGRRGGDDDVSDPDTAPQPRVNAAGMPVEPSGGTGGKRPSEEPPSGETVVLHERPASSAESTAKPKGPLPPGAPAKPSAAKPGAAPAKSTSERPPAPTGGVAKGEPPKGKESADKSGEEPGKKGERQGTVKVIVGTRRYHSTACPLIRGAGETGVETMTLAAAEAAGLTSCSVCQHDRETVG
ncbi:hypothetical protein [Nonomuraea monospora]|uniref:hypothetical protein n=1 Tax=Nonomuraea monospora TaxID=568818 RepID=UPI0031D04DBA